MRGEVDVLLSAAPPSALDGLLRFRLHRVLHLHLQHQVAAALQIQPQPDVVLSDSAISSAPDLR